MTKEVNKEVNDPGYYNCMDMETVIPRKITDFMDEEDVVIADDDSWKAHWKGMPEFKNTAEEYYKDIKVSFRTEEDYKAFAKLLDQKLTEKTKSIWYPVMLKDKNCLNRWINEE
jgi:predicted DNA binding protein